MVGKLYILNSPVITGEGLYKVKKVTAEEAKEMIKNCKEIVSAVGHQATAEILSKLLETPIPFNRVEIQMAPGDVALVFRLKQRLPEGTIIRTTEELEKIGYELMLIEKLE